MEFFVKHEIDFPMFLALGDDDLRVIGVEALGSRKKILAAIKQFRDFGTGVDGGTEPLDSI